MARYFGKAAGLVLLVVTAMTLQPASAEVVYEEGSSFIRSTFPDREPAAQLLWITKDLREEATRILGHEPGLLRVRYWGLGQRTAWIVDEIGKEEPITIGVVIEGDRIEQVRILTYREPRGAEVRYPFFTDQFRDATLTVEGKLDRGIDGISGATLSVSAVTRIARLALFLHSRTPYAISGAERRE